MTLYALKDPKGRIDMSVGLSHTRLDALHALYDTVCRVDRTWCYKFRTIDQIPRAAYRAARRLGWRIVKVRVVEEETK